MLDGHLVVLLLLLFIIYLFHLFRIENKFQINSNFFVKK
jgi:cbb3-type cytochrome oxidase subunit 3